jgi:hypothetical protein
MEGAAPDHVRQRAHTRPGIAGRLGPALGSAFRALRKLIDGLPRAAATRLTHSRTLPEISMLH